MPAITVRPIDINNPQALREVYQARIIELENALRDARAMIDAALQCNLPGKLRASIERDLPGIDAIVTGAA